MGTRNLTVVYSNGKYKVAQYGQFDGYPSGLGVQVLSFLKGCNVDALRDAVNKCTFLTDDELKEIDKKIDDILKDNPKFSWQKMYPELLRETTGDILNLILFKNKTKLKNSLEFAADSLFCEWAYVIDLDKNTFEVYKGFNLEPLTKEDRFYFLMNEANEMNNERKKYHSNPDKVEFYYPVKFVVEYDLNALPNETDFINAFNSEEEE